MALPEMVSAFILHNQTPKQVSKQLSVCLFELIYLVGEMTQELLYGKMPQCPLLSIKYLLLFVCCNVYLVGEVLGDFHQ